MHALPAGLHELSDGGVLGHQRVRALAVRHVDDPPPDRVHPVLGARDRVIDRFHDDVDHHGNEREPEQQVDAGGEEELGMFGDDVAEADRAERDEGEVEGLEVGPALPARVQQRAEQDVDEGDAEGDDRRQVELVVDLVLDDDLLVHLLQVAQLGFGRRGHGGVLLSTLR